MDSASVQYYYIATAEYSSGHVQPIYYVQAEQPLPAKAPRKPRAPKKQAYQVQPAATISKDDDVTGGPVLKMGEYEEGGGSVGSPAETVEKSAEADLAAAAVSALSGGAEEQKTEQIDTSSTAAPQQSLAEIFAAKAIAHGSSALSKSAAGGGGASVSGLAASVLGSARPASNILQSSHDIRKLNQERIQRINSKLNELKENSGGAVYRLNNAIEKLAKWNKRFKTLQRN